jgi:hypothetical protein
LYHVLIKVGDATREVEDAVREAGSAEAAGLHRHFFVSRADQTVVMATGDDAPIVRRLRSGRGWAEPDGTTSG